MSGVDNPYICAVCRRVLDVRMDAFGVHYQHTSQDEAAHSPEPIPMPPGFNEGRCDFCNSFGVKWKLPARDFTVPGHPGQSSYGGWAACERCATMIRREDWGALETQAVRRLYEKYGQVDDIAVNYVRRLYRLIRENTIGDLEQI